MSFSSQLKQYLQKLDDNAKKSIDKVKDKAHEKKGWVKEKMEDANDNYSKNSQE